MEKIQDIKLFTNEYNLGEDFKQEDLEFVDIAINKDSKLFLDPALIEGQAMNDKTWMQEANDTINDFFLCLFEAYRNGDQDKILRLLSYAHEPQETNLGMASNSNKGKGNTEIGLVKIFENLKVLLDENLVIEPMDTCVFIKKFAEDGMSDLITNILRANLYKFTVDQCLRFNIKLSEKSYKLGYFWDKEKSSWENLEGNVLINKITNKPLLLVPKSIVRKTYKYSIGEFFQKKILTDIQEKQFRAKTGLCPMKFSKVRGNYLVPPAKKVVLKEIIADIEHKEYATDYTIKNKGLIEEFRNEMKQQYSKGDHILTDEKLIKYIKK